jgi:septal ring factor EnvC (AmiA/AmiB activator)
MATDDPQIQQLGQVITALQDALSQSEEREAQLKAELEAVKQDNLRLAEANIQLQKQMQEQEQSKPKSKSESRSSALSVTAKVYGGGRPIGSNAELSKVNNQNIGWFD